MAIRFCKGKKEEMNLKTSIVFDSNVFQKAHDRFLSSEEEYIPLVDKNGNYICCCYDDKNIDNLLNKIYILFNTNYGIKKIFHEYKTSTIISLNEISFYLYCFLSENNCKINVYGELWDYLDIKPQNKVIGAIIYAEGNNGLSLDNLGYYKNTFPFNEYIFFEKLYNKMIDKRKLYNKKLLNRKKANKKILQKIKSGVPFMAARLGNTESIIANQYFTYYTKFWLKYLYTTSGFFSKKKYSEYIEDVYVKNDVDLYVQKTFDCIYNCDFHMCCFKNDVPLINRMSKQNSYNIDWYDLFTNLDEKSWISFLKNKKILIISSFNKTIKYQLNDKINNKKIFNNFELPNFDVIYYDFPKTFIGNYDSRINFFENYAKIFGEIRNLNFDVALIAAGAYGYFLASDIKNIGKQSIELCSGLYPIFGIKNKTQAIIRKVSSMYNENWIFPLEEKPKNYMEIEKGAYWE